MPTISRVRDRHAFVLWTHREWKALTAGNETVRGVTEKTIETQINRRIKKQQLGRSPAGARRLGEPPALSLVPRHWKAFGAQ